jgi:hypothetical protein
MMVFDPGDPVPSVRARNGDVALNPRAGKSRREVEAPIATKEVAWASLGIPGSPGSIFRVSLMA